MRNVSLLHFPAADYLSIVWKFMEEDEVLEARRWYCILNSTGYWIELQLSGREMRKGKLF